MHINLYSIVLSLLNPAKKINNHCNMDPGSNCIKSIFHTQNIIRGWWMQHTKEGDTRTKRIVYESVKSYLAHRITDIFILNSKRKILRLKPRGRRSVLTKLV